VSAAALQLAERETLAPFRGACRSCGRRVLAVDVDGREVVVEVAEVLEAFRCPVCAKVAAMGHTRSECPRCGLTGWIGVPLPLRGVAVDAMGHARLFEGRRSAGEAVHALHACTGTPVVY
jgi:ribosomal protein S27AE